MSKSVHGKLEKVRKPRVHIKYEVETNGAKTTKELPFVVGVLGDFAGDSAAEQKQLKDRKFVQIEGDNFDEVMSKMAPSVNMKVDNTLKGDGSQMSVELKFKSMEDFEPHKLVEQVEPLRKLIETRNKLSDLLSKADRSDELEKLLEQVLNDTNALKEVADQISTKAKKSDKE